MQALDALGCSLIRKHLSSDCIQENVVFMMQDEPACVGCKQCVFLAPAVFRMESQYGRSRVFAQWASKEDDIQASLLFLVSCSKELTMGILACYSFFLTE